MITASDAAGLSEDLAAMAEATRERKPTIPEVLPLIRRYAALPGNGTGGSLHIVIEDANVDSDHVEFCREWAHEHGDQPGAALAAILALMSRSQRRRIARANWYPE